MSPRPVHFRPVEAMTMAIERGKLYYLFFVQHYFFSHHTMAAIPGVILKLPPVQQFMAGEQIKSQYLDKLIPIRSYH